MLHNLLLDSDIQSALAPHHQASSRGHAAGLRRRFANELDDMHSLIKNKTITSAFTSCSAICECKAHVATINLFTRRLHLSVMRMGQDIACVADKSRHAHTNVDVTVATACVLQRTGALMYGGQQHCPSDFTRKEEKTAKDHRSPRRTPSAHLWATTSSSFSAISAPGRLHTGVYATQPAVLPMPRCQAKLERATHRPGLVLWDPGRSYFGLSGLALYR